MFQYFVETQRSNITPKGFYNHCKKLLLRAGNGAEGWLDCYTYDFWANNFEVEGWLNTTGG